MQKRFPVLALFTAAALYLSYREVFLRGGFVGGLAVGALLVGLFIMWWDYFSRRGRDSASGE